MVMRGVSPYCHKITAPDINGAEIYMSGAVPSATGKPGLQRQRLLKLLPRTTAFATRPRRLIFIPYVKHT